MSSKTATETLALGAGSHKRAVAGISSEILIGAIGESFRKPKGNRITNANR